MPFPKSWRDRRLPAAAHRSRETAMTTATTTKSSTPIVPSDRKAMAIGPLVLLIPFLAAVATACSSSHGAGSPISTAASGPSSVSPVVVLVHGFSPAPEGYSCADYWKDLETAFRQWDPSVRLVTVGYSQGDHHCDMR